MPDPPGLADVISAQGCHGGLERFSAERVSKDAGQRAGLGNDDLKAFPRNLREIKPVSEGGRFSSQPDIGAAFRNCLSDCEVGLLLAVIASNMLARNSFPAKQAVEQFACARPGLAIYESDPPAGQIRRAMDSLWVARTDHPARGAKG